MKTKHISVYYLVVFFSYLLATLYSFSINPQVKTNRKDSLKVENAVPAVSEQTEFKDFSIYKRSYTVHFDLDYVWKNYFNMNPYVAWSGPINYTKLVYHPEKGYQHGEIEEGSKLLLQLKLFKKLNLEALFIVTDVDTINHSIQFCYGEKNITKGLQEITFHQSQEGTVIKHFTIYKSASGFRDKILYPPFHKKCIDEFHKTMHTTMVKNSIYLSDKPPFRFR